MSDLIDRQAAIELIERMKPYHQDADDIAVMIANMPSAQPGWIPVTDRLPDKSGLYLVTAHNTAYGVEVYSRYWNLHPDGSFWSGWHGYEVLAWQPLPKPWEGEGHE